MMEVIAGIILGSVACYLIFLVFRDAYHHANPKFPQWEVDRREEARQRALLAAKRDYVEDKIDLHELERRYDLIYEEHGPVQRNEMVSIPIMGDEGESFVVEGSSLPPLENRVHELTMRRKELGRLLREVEGKDELDLVCGRCGETMDAKRWRPGDIHPSRVERGQVVGCGGVIGWLG